MPVSVEQLTSATHSLHDREGRTMYQTKLSLENNTLPGREGHPTDRQAFREFVSHRDDVMNLLRFYRSGLFSEPLTLGQIEDFGSCLVALPLYLAFRANNPVDENQMPPSVIDAHRAAQGLVLISEAILLERKEDRIYTPDEIVDFANGKNDARRNFFISEDGDESCPAPNRTVRGLLEADLLS